MTIQDREREKFVQALRRELGVEGLSLAGVLAHAAKMRKDAARLDWIGRQYLEGLSMELVVDGPHDGEYFVRGDSDKPGFGLTLRAAIDAAMANG